MASAPETKLTHANPATTEEEDERKKWGTHIMGAPAVPTAHPDNQKAASWKAENHHQIYHHQPYVEFSPIDKPTNNPFEPVIHAFNSWSRKADTIARNIWHNLKTGPSVSEAAWGKVNLTAKAISEGGFDSLFKHIFATDPAEKLKKTFACYLSTSAGPVAGTLYLCLNNKLIRSVMIPLSNISSISPVTLKENSSDSYIRIVTVDGHEFWFMGFVNFDKATDNLLNSLSVYKATEDAEQPVVV